MQGCVSMDYRMSVQTRNKIVCYHHKVKIYIHRSSRSWSTCFNLTRILNNAGTAARNYSSLIPTLQGNETMLITASSKSFVTRLIIVLSNDLKLELSYPSSLNTVTTCMTNKSTHGWLPTVPPKNYFQGCFLREIKEGK